MMQKKNNMLRKERDEEWIQKERIRIFYRELMEGDVDRVFAFRILYYVMGTMGSFMMMFPLGPAIDPDLRVIYVLAWLFLGMAVLFRMQPYVYVMAERVSAVLVYVPADKALMRQVQKEYLHRYLLKLGAACFVLQQVGALIDGTWSFWNLVYPVGMILFLYLAGLAYIGRK